MHYFPRICPKHFPGKHPVVGSARMNRVLSMGLLWMVSAASAEDDERRKMSDGRRRLMLAGSRLACGWCAAVVSDTGGAGLVAMRNQESWVCCATCWLRGLHWAGEGRRNCEREREDASRQKLVLAAS